MEAFATIVLMLCISTLTYQLLSIIDGTFNLMIAGFAFLGILISSTIVDFDDRKIKLEYKLELINQTTVKIESLSTNKIYKCKPEEIDSILDLDNL